MCKKLTNKTKRFFCKINNKIKTLVKSFFSVICRTVKKFSSAIFHAICIIFKATWKYLFFVLLLLPIALNNIFIDNQNITSRIGENYLIDVAAIIVSLLPMIFTILAVALSLPSEKIYGVTAIEFRRLRKKTAFSFLEMVIITIVIFVIYSIFSILKGASELSPIWVLNIWTLNLVAVIYSILFVCQEIPILVKREKTILKIIRYAWYKKLEDLDYSRKNKYDNLVKAMQNLILQKGIVYSYDSIKGKNVDNARILNSLLDVNNEYFFDVADKIDLLIGSSSNEYKSVSIIQAIDMSFDNLENLLKLNNDFNIIEVYGDGKYYYQLTRLLFNLRMVLNKYEANEKLKNSLNRLLYDVFYSVNYCNLPGKSSDFLYSFLNAITKITMSENELWFLRAIRDANYNTIYLPSENDEYYYFLSMYLYYLYYNDKKVPDILKENIIKFLNEESDGINSDGSNWISVFKHQIEYTQYSHFVQMLPKLLKILKDDISPWYQPKHCTSWSSADGWFSKEFIIRCWLEMLIFNYNDYQFKDDIFDAMLKELDETERNTLAVELNNHWIKNNVLDIRLKDESFLSFYHSKQDTHPCDEDDLVKKLKDVATSVIYGNLQNEFNEHQKQDVDLVKYKEKFVCGFKNAIANFSIVDKNINLNEEKFVCYDLLCDTRWSDNFVDNYVSKYDEAFKRLILKDVENNDELKREILCESNKEKILEQILKYEYISSNEYLLYHQYSQEQLSKLRELKRSDLFLPRITFYNKDAIKINLECNEEMSFVRKLNQNEINTIIDRDYKVFNGLYKYCESSDDSHSIFITREQIFNLIEKKYFYSRIVFRYKINYNYEDIYIVDIEDNK